MKILYIGNYRDGTGYGQAAEDYILSLVGPDIYEILINYQNTRPYYPYEQRANEHDTHTTINDRASISDGRDHLNKICLMNTHLSLSTNYAIDGLEFTKESIVGGLLMTFQHLLDNRTYFHNFNTYIIKSINIKVLECDTSTGEYRTEYFPVVKDIKLF